MEPTKLQANTRSWLKARENVYERTTIGFGLTSDWMTKWRECFFKPIVERDYTKPEQTRITFDTQLRTTLLVPRLILRFCFQTGRWKRKRRPWIETGHWTGSKSRRHPGRIVNHPSEEIRQLWASTENLIAFFSLVCVSQGRLFNQLFCHQTFYDSIRTFRLAHTFLWPI